MKLLLVLSITLILPWQWAAAVGAEPTNLEETMIEPPPSAASSESIAPVTVQQNRELVSPDARSDRLNNQAQQINQTMNRPQSQSNFLREALNLPDGMIIRGSSRGGIGIGTEY